MYLIRDGAAKAASNMQWGFHTCITAGSHVRKSVEKSLCEPVKFTGERDVKRCSDRYNSVRL